MNTQQQNNCISLAKQGTDSLAVRALAGTGKTYTLGQMAQVIPGTGRSTSFSKATVDELSDRMPPSFPARTMHGMGLDAIKAKLGKVKIDNRGDVLYSFIKDRLVELDENWQLNPPIRELVEKAIISGINPESDRFILADTPENWEDIADTFDIDFTPVVYDTARRALIHINRLALKDGVINFAQMLALPLFNPMPVQQYKYLLVDEAQDLSPIQHALLARSLRQGGKVICCGDPNQAIYAFAGAMSDSYTRLSQQFSCIELPLTVSFRCSKNVIAYAQNYVPEIEAAPDACEGDVIHHSSIEIESLPKTILCRNNAPLMALALKAIVRGRSCEIAGKDIGAGLKALTKRIASGKTSDSMRSQAFVEKLHKWADREISRKPRNKGKVNDKVAALSALANHHSTLGAIRRHIDELFVGNDGKRRPADIHLSTIHAAKGKEWPEVLILDPFLMPSKYAEKEWELQQEKNLGYVAVTRAKVNLHFTSSDFIE
jgi:DNA helicase II / ATP-dependent DNA helicase PcrA